MSAVAVLITDLRKAGVRLSREGARLIVEAPPGVVTPQIRAELSRSKQELLTTLGAEPRGATGDDRIAAEAVREMAGMFAAAYRRHQELRRVPEDRTDAERHRGLALSG